MAGLIGLWSFNLPKSQDEHSSRCQYVGVSENKGYLFEGHYYKDYSMLGSRFGYPCFGKLPCMIVRIKSSHDRNGMRVVMLVRGHGYVCCTACGDFALLPFR